MMVILRVILAFGGVAAEPNQDIWLISRRTTIMEISTMELLTCRPFSR
jgi:hypothetical protein